MQDLTPRQIVTELDRYIVGQKEAKRAVSVAVRNRWRRQQLPEEMRQEIAPKNILMIGPTGVGKTEIARRLAKLTGAPFIKVEASKFTEVGYYGRDVESMVRELVDNAIALIREQEKVKVEKEAETRVEDRLLDLLVPPPSHYGRPAESEEESPERYGRTREKMRQMLQNGMFEEKTVELSVEQKSQPMVFSNMGGMDQLDSNLQDMFEKFMPKQTARREMTIAQARKVLLEEEIESLINREQIQADAVELAENLGIIFLDEIDKISASEQTRGADVSREGVQRDLLPIVEGTTVQTRYGYVKTDHVLFIAAGAFHKSKPSDLMPELQGRFPIRVELQDLTKDDFIRILSEPKNALTKQYTALLETESVKLQFESDGIEALADYAFQVNQTTQNIGARRLYTIMERLLEDLSFEASEMEGAEVKVNQAYVRTYLDKVAHDEDLSRYIL